MPRGRDPISPSRGLHAKARLVVQVLGVLALSVGWAGCELVVDFDRSLIGAGADAGMLDPPIFDAGDALDAAADASGDAALPLDTLDGGARVDAGPDASADAALPSDVLDAGPDASVDAALPAPDAGSDAG